MQRCIGLEGANYWLINVAEARKYAYSKKIIICFNQDRNIFLGEIKKFQHCSNGQKTMDHLSHKMWENALYRLHFEAHWSFIVYLSYIMQKVQSKIYKKRLEITLFKRLYQILCWNQGRYINRKHTKIKHNRSYLTVIDKRKKEILIVEGVITSMDNLSQDEFEKCGSMI